MRKPWEESGSHRDDFGFEDRPRRSDRRFESRDNFKRRSDRRFDRRDEGFGRTDDGYGRRDRRRDDRKGSFSRRRDDFSGQYFGVRSGPRARAAMAGRGNVERRQSVPSRNALITLDADVARVFGTSEAVNAALRHLIALAGIMGEEAIKQAAIESQKEPQVDSVEEKEELQAEAKDNVDAIQTTEDDEEEEWFDLPVEGEKTE